MIIVLSNRVPGDKIPRAEFDCPICLKHFSLLQSEARHRIKKVGPFLTCSRVCGAQLRLARERARGIRMKEGMRE